jgi:hypothetical protein
MLFSKIIAICCENYTRLAGAPTCLWPALSLVKPCHHYSRCSVMYAILITVAS